MKKKLLFKAMLFDMDGVITNTMPDHYHAWRFILKQEAGIEVSHEEYIDGRDKGAYVTERVSYANNIKKRNYQLLAGLRE